MTENEIHELLGQALDLGSSTSYSPNEIRIAARPFFEWCIDVAALDADTFSLLQPRVIEQFIQHGIRGYTEASRANLRSRLLRLAETASERTQGRNVRLRPLSAAAPLQPYTHGEQASLRSWASSQSTVERRRNAGVLLALGLGAGLSAAEVANIRVGDVRVADGVRINVQGQRPRTTWVVAQWAAALERAVDGRPPIEYLFRPRRSTSWPNVITNFVGPTQRGVRPQTQRMRATWIATHLEAGTNVVILLRASGVDSLESFTRYVPYLTQPTDEEARDALLLCPV